MRTTRREDLGLLEEGRDRRGYSGRHAGKILDKVYRKTKDPYLEKMRRDLMDAHKRNDFQTINKLESLIHDYERRHL